MIPARHNFDLHAGFGWRWWLSTLADLLEDRQRHAKHIDILGQEQTLLVAFIGNAPQTASNDLFTQQLTGERTQAHDVGHVRGIPALGEHGDRDHVLQPLSRLATLANGIDQGAQLLFLFGAKQRLLPIIR